DGPAAAHHLPRLPVRLSRDAEPVAQPARLPGPLGLDGGRIAPEVGGGDRGDVRDAARVRWPPPEGRIAAVAEQLAGAGWPPLLRHRPGRRGEVIQGPAGGE